MTAKTHTALYAQAAGIVLRIASPLFREMVSKQLFSPDTEIFKAWSTLRSVVGLYLENCSTEMTVEKREEFVGALRFAHRLEHCKRGESGHAWTAIPEQCCECEVGALTRELAIVIEEAEVAA